MALTDPIIANNLEDNSSYLGRRVKKIKDGSKFYLLSEDGQLTEPCGIILSSGRFGHTSCIKKKIVHDKLKAVYWVFDKPTRGLIERQLDASKLHEEINDLNSLSDELSTFAHKQMIRFLALFMMIVGFFISVGIILLVCSFRNTMNGIILDPDFRMQLKILGVICIVSSLFALCVAQCICSYKSFKKAIDVKKKLIDYVENTLNEKYEDFNIKWEFVEDWMKIENADIAVTCIGYEGEYEVFV